jgi:hypothetical protein
MRQLVWLYFDCTAREIDPGYGEGLRLSCRKGIKWLDVGTIRGDRELALPWLPRKEAMEYQGKVATSDFHVLKQQRRALLVKAAEAIEALPEHQRARTASDKVRDARLAKNLLSGEYPYKPLVGLCDNVEVPSAGRQLTPVAADDR